MHLDEIKIRFINLKRQFSTKPFKKVFECEDFNNGNKVMAKMPDYDAYIAAKLKVEKKPSTPVEQFPLYEEPFLSKEQEFHLFRKYNYLKFKCNNIFEKYDENNVGSSVLRKLEAYLSKIANIKQHITGANARLAFKLAKQKQYADFNSALSDAYFGLVYCIDHFDYTRNFKFTTYAYYAIADFIRKGAYSDRIAKSILIGNDEVIDVQFARIDENDDNEIVKIVAGMLNNITSRERDIIKHYYGIGVREMSLGEIGDIFKISKERVRQIKAAGMLRMKKWEVKHEREKSERLHYGKNSSLSKLSSFES